MARCGIRAGIVWPVPCASANGVGIRRECEEGWRDRLLAELAARQHGVVSRGQLRRAGLSESAVDRRLRAGRLHRIDGGVGVYAVGHRLVSQRGLWMAAVLAGGRDAVLSHRSAAALWGILQSARLEVTVDRHRRSRPRLTIHHSALAADERTVVEGIPVTTTARTLLDLAAVCRPDRLARAVHEAEVRRLGAETSLRELLERHPPRPGSRALRRILAARALGSRVTRSELEERFATFVARHGLPEPLHNRRVAGMECDAVWPEPRVIVELDGRASHQTARGFERDRSRDRRLQAAGWRVVRVTWLQLHQTPRELARDLRTLLT